MKLTEDITPNFDNQPQERDVPTFSAKLLKTDNVDWYQKMIDNRKIFELEVERVTSQYSDLIFNRV